MALFGEKKSNFEKPDQDVLHSCFYFFGTPYNGSNMFHLQAQDFAD